MMKRMILWLLVAVLLCTSLGTLGACAPADGDGGAGSPNENGSPLDDAAYPPFERGGSGARIYGDYYFYERMNANLEYEFCYQLLNQLQPAGIPLYNDLLAGTEDNPFGDISRGASFFIDEKATEQNGGVPVVLVIYKSFSIHTKKTTRKLVSVNLATSRVTVLRDDLPTNFSAVNKYGDWLYFTTYESEKGGQLHRMRIDGTEQSMVQLPKNLNCRIQAIYRDQIYFLDESKRELYRCDLDFGNITPLFDGITGPSYVFAADGYLYYLSNYRSIAYDEDHAGRSFDLVRRSLSDLATVETVLTDVAGGQSHNHLYFYHLSANRRLLELDGKTYYDDGTGTMLLYDTRTGQSRVISPATEWGYMKSMNARSEQYVVVHTIFAGDRPSEDTVVNLITGEETLIPQ